MRKQYNIYVSGKVQTVGYRYSAVEKAKDLGLVGFARNEEDGSVYIEAHGEVEKLDEFIEWCREGPRFSKVKSVSFQDGPELKKFSDFNIV